MIADSTEEGMEWGREYGGMEESEEGIERGGEYGEMEESQEGNADFKPDFFDYADAMFWYMVDV
jgi:hypothetical protein